MEFITDTVEKTICLGEKLGKLLNNGDIACINGELGVGKTHFVKGIASGLYIYDYITSPTFNIVNEYEGKKYKLYHFDVYRVNDPDEIYAIGFDEYIFSDGISVIEWANLIEDIMPKERINILIEKVPNMEVNFRKITIDYTGERYDYVKEINLC